MTLVEKARAFAVKWHGDQMYSDGDASYPEGKPYVYHLDAVVNVLRHHGHTRPDVLATAYLHDVQEDTEATTWDLEAKFGENVAWWVFLLSKPKGERSDVTAKYLELLAESRVATLVKLADRIANVEECVATGHSLLRRYRKEQDEFVKYLYQPGEHEDMWLRLAVALDRDKHFPPHDAA